jgi:hypothetical protein
VAIFRLDYLSCFLTIVASFLVGRKMWTGLVVSALNSLIVCVIGLHTSQYGFIPANVFCVCMNAFNLRAWLKAQKNTSIPTADPSGKLLSASKRLSVFKNAAGRCLVNPFNVHSEAELGNPILSLAINGVGTLAPAPIVARVFLKVVVRLPLHQPSD